MDFMMLAAAASDKDATPDPTNVEWAPAITTLIVFGLVCLVLFTKVWPKITSGLDERQAKIRQEIEAAEAAQAEARAAMKSQQAELAQARTEANEMIAKAKSDAEALAQSLRDQAQQQLSELREQASQEIRAAKEAAIGELHAESGRLATSIASGFNSSSCSNSLKSCVFAPADSICARARSWRDAYQSHAPITSAPFVARKFRRWARPRPRPRIPTVTFDMNFPVRG